MTDEALNIINEFSRVVGNPKLTEEVVSPNQHSQPEYQEVQQTTNPMYYQSGMATYGVPPRQGFSPILPTGWHNQVQRPPINITDEEIDSLAKISILFQTRIQQVFTEGFKYFLVKTLKRNKYIDEHTVEQYDNTPEPTPEQTDKYNEAVERLERLDALESFESAMSLEEFEKLLIKLKKSELKQQRDMGVLELPSTWGVTWNLIGLNISGMLGSNLKVVSDVVHSFKRR